MIAKKAFLIFAAFGVLSLSAFVVPGELAAQAKQTGLKRRSGKSRVTIWFTWSQWL